ncbi:MAG: bifunctional metallophosphatase/5'-nucleotidase [Acidobacteria bacterium 13_1_20CM_3_53_8]|nr:MAG: bifunctional metallophosphatase/5'-nucleotidase [Acidobacteria bacterium 13_1_20CM_3_53_8]
MLLIHSNARRATLALLLTLVTFISTSSQTARECTVRVTLLQVNDVYQISPVDRGTRGGIGRVATLRKRIAENSPHTLFLLAGDTISPSIESNTFHGQQMIDAWNLSGLDYATFGNHEFDFGDDVLVQRIRESKFKWIAANVVDRRTGRPFGGAESFVIREFEGVKVGIIGLVLPETKQTSRPSADVDFRDPCETAREVVPQMKAKGAKVIVGLTHLAMSEDKRVAQCADFDLIVGGHEHNLLQSLSGRTPIFKMTSDAREMAEIDLNIGKTSGALQSMDWKVITVTDQIPEDPAYVAGMKKYQQMFADLDQVVGRTSVELDALQRTSRSRETNMGDFIADAYRSATNADVALFNGGAIRADMTYAPGALTKRDVLSVLPYQNQVVKIEITGATLREALEHGVSRSAEDIAPGQFPQVSGVRFTFDARRPAGSRVTSVTVQGRPLDDRKTYTLATNIYIIEGGDGYTMFKNPHYIIAPQAAQTETDILLKLIRDAQTIAPQVDGRIKRVDEQQQRTNNPCAFVPSIHFGQNYVWG